MSTIRKNATAATAALAAAVLALAGCSSSSDESSSESESEVRDTMVLGELFPQTGSLSYLAPPEIAAAQQAIDEINEAGGVLGNDVTAVSADTSDADHADQNTSATESVLAEDPSAIIGPASSSVVQNVYREITEAGIPMISMGATSTDFSGLDDFFFRTVPPDTVQGAVLGNVIVQDGVQTLAIAAFNDEYGTSLRDVIADTVEASGVEVVYGADDAFDPTETNFSSIVTSIIAADPDALAIVAFDQTIPLIRELASQGFDTSRLYLVDGNTSDYSDEYDAGLLEGAKGTIPGANPSDEFRESLLAIDDTLSTFTYAAETYDGVMLFALAAERGGSADGETIQANLAAVSGTNGGTECSTYADCVALLDDGEEIQYVGQAGIGPFNENNDPSYANIGIYVYDDDNVPQFDHVESGDVPTE